MIERSRILVDLGPRSYPIVFAPLSTLGEQVNAQTPPARTCVLVTNPVVGEFYLAPARAALEEAGWQVRCVEVADGEEAKQLSHYERLVSELLGGGIDRQTLIVALGGGVTGDLVGFAAATLLRGLPLVQVPTSLLAMVDSSVGGKTGLNTETGKNLLGAFHQPTLVHVDVALLQTLSDREFRCGLGEVVKHAVIADAEFFSWLEEHVDALCARDEKTLEWVVSRCCAIKAAVVARDEHEKGERAVLNLGHTVGHAIEKAAGFGVVPHGEAVGIGMLAETVLAVEQGWSAPETPVRIAALLKRLGLPLIAPSLPFDELQMAVTMDKKTSRGKIGLPVATAVGEVRLFEVTPDFLEPALLAALGKRRS